MRADIYVFSQPDALPGPGNLRCFFTFMKFRHPLVYSPATADGGILPFTPVSGDADPVYPVTSEHTGDAMSVLGMNWQNRFCWLTIWNVCARFRVPFCSRQQIHRHNKGARIPPATTSRKLAQTSLASYITCEQCHGASCVGLRESGGWLFADRVPGRLCFSTAERASCRAFRCRVGIRAATAFTRPVIIRQKSNLPVIPSCSSKSALRYRVIMALQRAIPCRRRTGYPMRIVEELAIFSRTMRSRGPFAYPAHRSGLARSRRPAYRCLLEPPLFQEEVTVFPATPRKPSARTSGPAPDGRGGRAPCSANGLRKLTSSPRRGPRYKTPGGISHVMLTSASRSGLLHAAGPADTLNTRQDRTRHP